LARGIAVTAGKLGVGFLKSRRGIAHVRRRLLVRGERGQNSELLEGYLCRIERRAGQRRRGGTPDPGRSYNEEESSRAWCDQASKDWRKSVAKPLDRRAPSRAHGLGLNEGDEPSAGASAEGIGNGRRGT